MKLKSFFFKSITILIFLIIATFYFSCQTFSYKTEEFTGQTDENFLNHLYPIKTNKTNTSVNETLNFCSFFIDENGIFYSLIIELNKLNLNNTEFWFYELFFYDYSPMQKVTNKNTDGGENKELKPIVFKITQTSINPLTPLKLNEKTINLGKNYFSWKENKLIFNFVDKKNTIKITANLYPKNNFTIAGGPLVKILTGQAAFFNSAELNVECEYTLFYSEKEKVKKKLKNGYGLLYKSWGTNTISDYELHFLKFSTFKLKDIEINPPQIYLDKSYLFFNIPKTRFSFVLEMSKENNIPNFNLLQNFIPENDYRYSKIIPDKNRRYPSNFSFLLKNNLIRLLPVYERSTIQFFTHDCWFGMVTVYDVAGRIIGLGFSNLYEYSRMR